jgi:hypothetical protein
MLKDVAQRDGDVLAQDDNVFGGQIVLDAAVDKDRAFRWKFVITPPEHPGDGYFWKGTDSDGGIPLRL